MDHSVVIRRSDGAERIAEKLQRQLRMSLDRCDEILSIPLDEVLAHPSAHILGNMQMMTVRAVIHACTKLGVEAEKARIGELDRRWQAELDARLAGRAEEPPTK